MYKPLVFIISKRKELSIKYKKLIEGLSASVCLISKLDNAIEQIKLQEPEFIIVSDTIDDNLSGFLKKIRALTYNFRPVLIAISKSDELTDRLETLEAGADDFFDEAMPSKEFKARINAHIRRSLESSINLVTGLIDNKLLLKVIKKTINSDKDKAFLLFNISEIDFYKDIYGSIAYEKVLQTISAILNSTLASDDILGQYSRNEFILITSTIKAEKIAEFLTFAFESILEKFYTESDFQNKFILYSSDSKEEKKVPLMKLNTAVLLGGHYKDEKEVLNLLYNVLKLTEKSNESTYVIDRPKISGSVAKEKKPANKVLIMEPDSALSFLIKTSLDMNNIDNIESNSYEDFMQKCEKYKPAVIVLDLGNSIKKEGLKALSELKENIDSKLYLKMPKIIFSTNLQNKKEILANGADLYLPKPYEIDVLLDWIKKFLNEN